MASHNCVATSHPENLEPAPQKGRVDALPHWGGTVVARCTSAHSRQTGISNATRFTGCGGCITLLLLNLSTALRHQSPHQSTLQDYRACKNKHIAPWHLPMPPACLLSNPGAHACQGSNAVAGETQAVWHVDAKNKDWRPQRWPLKSNPPAATAGQHLPWLHLPRLAAPVRLLLPHHHHHPPPRPAQVPTTPSIPNHPHLYPP